jgi:predicted amidophosphoribosyltransferase
MNDITQNPDRTNLGAEPLYRERTSQQPQYQQAVQMNAANGVACPHCGAINEPEALFCASCGNAIGTTSCPYCGAAVDADADFCESCRHYIRKDVCSFCGAYLTGSEAYCPECGSPRGGIVCPVCRTQNDFSFCKQCGTPLTEEARLLKEKVMEMPEFQQMQKLADELQKLDTQIPYVTEQDKERDRKSQELRQRVLMLLAQDRGLDRVDANLADHKVMSKDEFDKKKQERMDMLSRLLDQMAQLPQAKPAQVRNYAMACKPQGVRLAWQCNFKHALHSSPCGCAKPQMGGKWIILGKGTKKEIKDDI